MAYNLLISELIKIKMGVSIWKTKNLKR
jgi:hypothetical protein